jgi:hypothetical protein
VRAAFRTSTSSIRMDAVEPAIPHLLDVWIVSQKQSAKHALLTHTLKTETYVFSAMPSWIIANNAKVQLTAYSARQTIIQRMETAWFAHSGSPIAIFAKTALKHARHANMASIIKIINVKSAQNLSRIAWNVI